MRTNWLGVVVLLLTAGCAHDGVLRPQAGAVPLTEDGDAAVIGDQGVTLVAYGSNWKGQPRNLERRLTAVQVRLENRSGRPLSIRYEGFTLDGRKHYVARAPAELGQLMAARDTTYRPPKDVYGTRRATPPIYQASRTSSGQPAPYDMTYTSHNGTSPYTPPPCLTCASSIEAARLPTPDMLRLALTEGPLENGQVREGFLYFEEPLRSDDVVTLKVKLVDASTGEPFGTLSIPFEVH